MSEAAKVASTPATAPPARMKKGCKARHRASGNATTAIATNGHLTKDSFAIASAVTARRATTAGPAPRLNAWSNGCRT